MEDASLMLGNVTETLIVKMVLMKILKFAITECAILKLNSLALMVAVFRNFGCAILITIVGMILMSLRTDVAKRTALTAGRGVQEDQTTVAYRSGCSATARMIAEITAMNNQSTAPSVMKLLTSSARTTDVYQNDGCVTLRMTAEIFLTRMKKCVKALTEAVRSQRCVATMPSAFLTAGGATMMTTAVMVQMKSAVVNSNARMERSSATVVTV